MRKYLLKIYNILLKYSNKKIAPYLLMIIAFSDSSFFFVAPDFILIPISIANPKKAYYYAFLCAIFAALGALLGYIIGYFAYKYIGEFLIQYSNYESKFNTISNFYNKYDVLTIFIFGFIPIPYFLITIFSGFVKINLFSFLFISILSRSLRFFIIALFISIYAEKAKMLIEKHIVKFSIFLLLIALFLVLLYYIFKFYIT